MNLTGRAGPQRSRESFWDALKQNQTLMSGLFMAVAFVVTLLLMRSGNGERVCVMVGLSGIFLYLIIKTPAIGVPLAVGYVLLLGTTRRLFAAVFGYASFDPLLMVGPIISLLYLSTLLGRKMLPRDTPIAVWMARLLVVMVLQIFNPLQGGISVGMAGVIFYIVPLGWYYIGRSFGTAAVYKSFLTIAIALTFVGAVYGVYQTWFGFQPWEEEWMRLNPATALSTGSGFRPFSLFNAPAEYVHVMCIGLVLTYAALLRGNRLLIVLVPAFLLALLTSSVRGTVVFSLLALIVLWGVQGKTIKAWAPRLALAAFVGVFGMVWSLQQVSTDSMTPYMKSLIGHQKEGLLDPFGEKSTASGHGARIFDGVIQGFTRPYGSGLGSTTFAAAKFGGESGGTEGDIGDMFVALGAVGGFFHLMLVVAVLRTAFRSWQQTRSVVPLCAIGVLAGEFGQWLHAGHYAPTMLIWFSVGAMDRWKPALDAPATPSNAVSDGGKAEQATRNERRRVERGPLP